MKERIGRGKEKQRKKREKPGRGGIKEDEKKGQQKTVSERNEWRKYFMQEVTEKMQEDRQKTRGKEEKSEKKGEWLM